MRHEGADHRAWYRRSSIFLFVGRRNGWCARLLSSELLESPEGMSLVPIPKRHPPIPRVDSLTVFSRLLAMTPSRVVSQ